MLPALLISGLDTSLHKHTTTTLVITASGQGLIRPLNRGFAYPKQPINMFAHLNLCLGPESGALELTAHAPGMLQIEARPPKDQPTGRQRAGSALPNSVYKGPR